MIPAQVNLPAYTGEPREYRLTFVQKDGSPLVLSGSWAAQTRKRAEDPEAVDLVVDDTDQAVGVLVLTIPGADLERAEDVRLYDLSGSVFGTILRGKIPVTPDVTDGPAGTVVTELTIALGPDEVRVVSSAQIGPRGLPGDDGREVELSTSATHVRWRYAGDAEWTDLVALADVAGDDGTEVELGTSATHIQWRYVGGAWADLVALADLKGEDGFGVPDPAGQAADLVPVTDGAGAYSLAERGITQEAADAAIRAVAEARSALRGGPGQYVTPDHSARGTGGGVLNRLVAAPLVLAAPLTIDRVAIETTAAATGGGTRIGIYASTPGGMPSVLLHDFGVIDTSVAPGFLTLPVAAALPAGRLWIAVVHQGDGLPTTRTISAAPWNVPLSAPTTPSAATPSLAARHSGGVTGALPDPWVDIKSTSQGSAPLVWLREA